MTRGLLAVALLAAGATSGAQAMEYTGVCAASAGAFLDNTHFAVASDETNTLQIYERGKPDPIGLANMKSFTGFKKSDLEGAAAIGDRVYWISSHSFSKPKPKEGKPAEDKPERQLFFATRIVVANGKPTLEGVGKPVTSLRDKIADAAGVQASELNIEALSAMPDGISLMIGLRGPLRAADKDSKDGKPEAIVIQFENPAEIVDDPAVEKEKQKAPRFGKAFTLKLEGLGLRSMDLIGTNPARYIIVAGPVDDGPGFALFRWGGPGTKPPEKIKDAPDLAELTPEGAMAVPGTDLVQLLSDDEKVKKVKCDDEDDPPEKRRFRSVDVTVKP
jgi:hypothetical protein